jgi:hypothetical protein
MSYRTALRAIALGCLTILAVLSVNFAAHSEQTLKVYHVGNSVTDTINYEGLNQLAESRGHKYVFGRHMIPGAPLSWIWQHPDDGLSEDPFGHYRNALSNYQWDVLTLQPFDRHLDGDEGDLVMARNFIDLALAKSPNLRIYIYSRWPRRDEDGHLDFGSKWLRDYTGGWDGTEETKDYFEKLTFELRTAYPKLQDHVFVVPVGDVLYELDQRIKAGQVPGYTSITQVYADGIHFNDVGSYIVGSTFYATLFQENPKGLTASPYNVNNPQLVGIIQDAVWKVVSTHPLSAVVAAQPQSKTQVKQSNCLLKQGFVGKVASEGDISLWPS